ncbi:hypothetical protein DV737_g477, partial [Chaetothyriales sp. CBS 132003]
MDHEPSNGGGLDAESGFTLVHPVDNPDWGHDDGGSASCGTQLDFSHTHNELIDLVAAMAFGAWYWQRQVTEKKRISRLQKRVEWLEPGYADRIRAQMTSMDPDKVGLAGAAAEQCPNQMDNPTGNLGRVTTQSDSDMSGGRQAGHDSMIDTVRTTASLVRLLLVRRLLLQLLRLFLALAIYCNCHRSSRRHRSCCRSFFHRSSRQIQAPSRLAASRAGKMPCFKGLAVSIHTPNGPLPEHAVQKASRLSRISTYIPVPPPTIPPNSTSTKPEPSTFAISITLLTPGQDVPYSTPKKTPENPSPKPRTVGGLPGHGDDRRLVGAIGPYVPLTTSPNETIAAYIYFDGRAKEEVATLLRKGEETWVNSRWVGVPESEGGGLAEREFLFREVGLERWLNGLDLEGKDAAATIQRRRQKLEKRRRKRKEASASDDEATKATKAPRRKSTMKYGPDGDSEDDDPIPEAAGQIKVALFRVLASGEIKRGDGQNGHANGESKADIDHTTSFAKPKTLDPKTISTQTVTGIDPTDKPYAVFTFFYRGERQLQKMGILQPKSDKPVPNDKRRSLIGEIPKLTPLKKHGAAGFSGFRDTHLPKGKRDDDDMESDTDDNDADILGKMDDDAGDAEAAKDSSLLSPEDAERTGQVAEGIRKIKLKRQHSAEPLTSNGGTEPRKTSKSGSGSPCTGSTPNIGTDSTYGASPETNEEAGFMLGSPLKKQRSSMGDFDDEFKRRLQRGLAAGIGQVLSSSPDPKPAPSGLHFGGSLSTKRIDAADDDSEL